MPLLDDLQAFVEEAHAARGVIGTIDWRMVADVIAVKMALAAQDGGITSWTWGGRTVTKSYGELKNLYDLALAMANRQRGGIETQPIFFA